MTAYLIGAILAVLCLAVACLIIEAAQKIGSWRGCRLGAKPAVRDAGALHPDVTPQALPDWPNGEREHVRHARVAIPVAPGSHVRLIASEPEPVIWTCPERVVAFLAMPSATRARLVAESGTAAHRRIGCPLCDAAPNVDCNREAGEDARSLATLRAEVEAERPTWDGETKVFAAPTSGPGHDRHRHVEPIPRHAIRPPPLFAGLARARTDEDARPTIEMPQPVKKGGQR